MDSLGEKTCEFSTEEENKSQAPWVFIVSKGGLTAGFNKFIDDIEKFEIDFRNFHGSETHGLRRDEIKLIDNFKARLISKFG